MALKGKTKSPMLHDSGRATHSTVRAGQARMCSFVALTIGVHVRRLQFSRNNHQSCWSPLELSEGGKKKKRGWSGSDDESWVRLRTASCYDARMEKATNPRHSEARLMVHEKFAGWADSLPCALQKGWPWAWLNSEVSEVSAAVMDSVTTTGVVGVWHMSAMAGWL